MVMASNMDAVIPQCQDTKARRALCCILLTSSGGSGNCDDALRSWQVQLQPASTSPYISADLLIRVIWPWMIKQVEVRVGMKPIHSLGSCNDWRGDGGGKKGACWDGSPEPLNQSGLQWPYVMGERCASRHGVCVIWVEEKWVSLSERQENTR